VPLRSNVHSTFSDPPRRKGLSIGRIRGDEVEVVFATKVPRTLQRALRQHSAKSGVKTRDFLIAAVRERLARVGQREG
jgi:hypothetical protein